jgi:hypothetical protein
LAIVVPRRSWLEISLWETGKGRKKEEQGKKERREMASQTAELDRRDQVTATNSWPSSLRKEGTEVDSQVAAPNESSTPNLHRATNRSTKSADGRVATEAAWLNGNNLEKKEIKKKKKKEKIKEKA